MTLKPTPTGWALMALAALAVGAGFRAGSQPLAVLGQALALTLAAMAWLARSGARKVRLSRRHPSWAFEDERVPVRLTVTNGAKLPLRWLEVEDQFPADRDALKALCLPGPLAPGRPAEAAYDAPCRKRRGGYVVGPAAVRLRDPLGAFEALVGMPGSSDLTVFPRTVPIARFPIAGQARWDNVDTETIPKAGSSLNFSGTREYRQGDSLRFIHWGATAHTAKLIVKEFELNVATEVSVFLDAHYFAVKGMGRETTFEYSIKAAASVARYALARGSRVRLVCQGKSPLEFPLGAGEYHLLSILKALTRAQPDGREPLARVLKRWLGRIETGSTVVLIFNSVTIDLKAYIEAISLLRARQIKLVVVLVDDNTFLNLWESAQAKKVHALFIPDVIKLLVSLGVTVYTLAQGDDLASRFEKPYLYVPSAG